MFGFNNLSNHHLHLHQICCCCCLFCLIVTAAFLLQVF
eukprot:UN09333